MLTSTTPDTTAQYRIYGNTGSGPIDYGTVLATVTGTSWTSPTLAAGSSWAWAVRAVDPATSLVEQNVDQRAFLVLDAGVADVTNLPAGPSGLTVRPWSNGSLLVEWHAVISPRDPRAATGFGVYAGTGGTPSYAAPAVLTPAYPGVQAYRAFLTNLAPGMACTVGVRASNAVGTEANTTTATATPTTTAPANVTGLTASLI